MVYSNCGEKYEDIVAVMTQVCGNMTVWIVLVRESSFNMGRGGCSEKFLTTERGPLKKWRGAPKICILQNQQEGWGS